MCLFCNEEESIYHVLVDCALAKEMWRQQDWLIHL
ncbi:hypothetical protein MANES_01G110401v8 [Manihot esculenta]|uniref:Uncharacterized protein n=1 Tax=Manihot esculenta TaxID=3983 RepID=A0ACB7ICA1_MANES|nr:hypothetical protein MANES_01G110401v8 [Manihot esculenta]